MIARVEPFPVILPRDLAAAKGTAGSPTELSGGGAYRWSRDYPALYSTRFETALIKVTLADGTVGWGEAQAPLAPQVVCAIVEHLLSPALEGLAFDGSPERIHWLYDRMIDTMRVRGQTGGFMLDAVAGVDLALWDLAGKVAGMPVAGLLSDSPKARVPAYLSGLRGGAPSAAGWPLVKLYFESDWDSLLGLVDAVAALGCRVAVDGLWHAPVDRVAELDARPVEWLECPFPPEEVDAHLALGAALRTPLALGESYRSVAELRPFLRAVRIMQPDLGRCGMTGSVRIAGLGRAAIPHLSIALGPQVAAAIHFAAAMGNCEVCEYNPWVVEMANRFLREPIRMEQHEWVVPAGPGWGIELDEALLHRSRLLI